MRSEAVSNNRPADLINIALEKVVEAGLGAAGLRHAGRARGEGPHRGELRYLSDAPLGRRVTAANDVFRIVRL
jgi:hypothetical protein